MCFLVPWREISLLKNYFLSKQSEGFCVWMCFPRLVTSVKTVGLSQNHKSPQIPQEMVSRCAWWKFTPCKVPIMHSMKWESLLAIVYIIWEGSAASTWGFVWCICFFNCRISRQNSQVFGHPFLLMIIDLGPINQPLPKHHIPHSET